MTKFDNLQAIRPTTANPTKLIDTFFNQNSTPNDLGGTCKSTKASDHAPTGVLSNNGDKFEEKNTGR